MDCIVVLSPLSCQCAHMSQAHPSNNTKQSCEDYFELVHYCNIAISSGRLINGYLWEIYSYLIMSIQSGGMQEWLDPAPNVIFLHLKYVWQLYWIKIWVWKNIATTVRHRIKFCRNVSCEGRQHLIYVSKKRTKTSPPRQGGSVR